MDSKGLERQGEVMIGVQYVKLKRPSSVTLKNVVRGVGPASSLPVEEE